MGTAIAFPILHDWLSKYLYFKNVGLIFNPQNTMILWIATKILRFSRNDGTLEELTQSHCEERITILGDEAIH